MKENRTFRRKTPTCDRSRSKQRPESNQITDIVTIGAPISELPSYISTMRRIKKIPMNLNLANVNSLMIYLLQQNI